MRVRTKGREIALHILYQVEILKAEKAEIASRYLENNKQPQEIVDFVCVLVDGTITNITAIDDLLKKHVKNWDINRMAFIDRNILRLACFEILYTEDIPPKVAINEAIELAKRFGDIDSPRFVNGILDKIYKTERAVK